MSAEKKSKDRLIFSRSRLLFAVTVLAILTYQFVLKPDFRKYVWIQISTNASKLEGENQVIELALCENLLRNITHGKWMRKNVTGKLKIKLERLEMQLDTNLSVWQQEVGILTELSPEGKCGYRNSQGRHPYWCANEKPCCSDDYNGTCGLECECPNCVDTRRIHAEVSDWVIQDSRCRMRNYTSERACQVLKEFSSIYFVGDSLGRKMARGLILTLRSDADFGAIKKEGTMLLDMCSGYNQMYWKICRFYPGNLREQLQDNTAFCGKNPLDISHHSIQELGNANGLFKLITGFAGKKGTVILLSLGVHEQCDAKRIISLLEPSIHYLKNFHNVTSLAKNQTGKFSHWPHLVFMSTDMAGLLKPTKYQETQGAKRCSKLCDRMHIYLKKHGIPVLDWRNLTTGVKSFDGTHYGLAVNLMKVQILLNYLESVKGKFSKPRKTHRHVAKKNFENV